MLLGRYNMNNINDIFDAFPDYDVFDEKNSEIKPAKKKRRRKKDEFRYIQYDERNDFRNEQDDEDYEEPEHSTDYRDDYGVYRVYEERIKNSVSLLFFPFTFVWLESILRLGCSENLYSFSMVFVVLFSLSLSGIFTLLMTFFGEKFNRTMVKILVAVITVFYCFQMIYFNLNGCFWWFGGSSDKSGGSLAAFNKVMDVMSDKVVYLLCCFVPLVLFLFFGKFIFPFRKIRIQGKICLILAAVLLHFSALTFISFDKKTESPKSNYAVYHQQAEKEVVQERFGLYTMITKEITGK